MKKTVLNEQTLAEFNRIAEINARICEFRIGIPQHYTSAQIIERTVQVGRAAIDESYGEHREEAAIAKAACLNRLSRALDVALLREAEERHAAIEAQKKRDGAISVEAIERHNKGHDAIHRHMVHSQIRADFEDARSQDIDTVDAVLSGRIRNLTITY